MSTIKEIQEFYDSLKNGDIFINKQSEKKKIKILEIGELDLNTYSCKILIKNNNGMKEYLSIYLLKRLYKKEIKNDSL